MSHFTKHNRVARYQDHGGCKNTGATTGPLVMTTGCSGTGTLHKTSTPGLLVHHNRVTGKKTPVVLDPGFADAADTVPAAAAKRTDAAQRRLRNLQRRRRLQNAAARRRQAAMLAKVNKRGKKKGKKISFSPITGLRLSGFGELGCPHDLHGYGDLAEFSGYESVEYAADLLGEYGDDGLAGYSDPDDLGDFDAFDLGDYGIDDLGDLGVDWGRILGGVAGGIIGTGTPGSAAPVATATTPGGTDVVILRKLIDQFGKTQQRQALDNARASGAASHKGSGMTIAIAAAVGLGALMLMKK